MIDSILVQSHRDWELLFVDDGSEDDTVELIEKAAGKDSRIRLVSAARKLGKVKAFNHCYAAATGQIMVLLAGDDRLPARSLAARAASLASSY